jgi:predicted Zn-dependent peptidase
MQLVKFYRTIILFIIIVISSFSLNHAENKLYKIPEGVSVYLLDNGIQVMLIEKPTLPMVGINTLIKVGSAYENFATSGMSHMLEHLLFNGTSTMTQKELYDSTDFIGGYNNAHTGEYFTNFMMVTPSDNIIDGMKLQAAMLFDSVLPEEKFEKEKGIVLEEIAKSLAKSSEQIDRNVVSVIYEGHALSLPTLGTYSTIENMKRDDVYDFYKKYYVPNNMIISVIGNIKTDEMLENIKSIYGTAPPTEINELSSQLGTGFTNTLNNQKNKTFHRFHNGENTQLQLFFEIDDSYPSAFPELLKLALERNKEVVKDQLSESFPGQIKELDFSTRETPLINHLQVSLILESDSKLDDIKQLLYNLLGGLKLEIAYETVQNESVKARTRFLQNTEKPHMFGIYNASIIGESGIEGILSSYTGREIIDAYSYLKNFSLPEEYITIVQYPQFSNTGSSAEEKVQIKVYDNITGGPVLISKRSEEGGLLAIHYLVKNKAELENKFGRNDAQIWHASFGERMESAEIQKESAKFGFNFTVNDNPFIPMDNIYLNPEFGYIRVEGLSDSVEAAVEFLNSQMINFIPTEEEFSASQNKLKAPSMMGHGNMSKKIFDEKVNAVLYEDDRFESSSEALKYENLLKFGNEYFHPSNMIVSVVSPEENEKIYAYFSNFMKSGGSIGKELGYVKQLNELNAPQKIELEGGGEQSYLYYGFQKLVSESDKPALQVLSLILSDNIIFDIREKKGLAYSMSAGIKIVKDKAMFYIEMGTRPENADQIIPQFPEYFTPEFSAIITDQMVKKAVNMYLGKMMFRRLSSINQAYYLGYSKYFYDDIYHDSKSLDQLKMVTSDNVKEMIKKYMIVENPIEIYIR